MYAIRALHLIFGGLASGSILESRGFGAVEAQGLLWGGHAQLFRRQTNNNATCRANMTTTIWTSCAGFLTEFNLTLDYFRLANPNIGPSCANFQPGSTYCISLSK